MDCRAGYRFQMIEQYSPFICQKMDETHVLVDGIGASPCMQKK